MHRGLLAWNIILTVLLVAGFGVLGNYIYRTNMRMNAITNDFQEICAVIDLQAKVMNEHADLINEVNDAYLSAIEGNRETMTDMAELVDKYRDVIDKNSVYYKEILEKLDNLSIVLTQ
ncbi:hypothetical protein ACFLXG_00210 [Chloroflexota bacterium]